MTDGTNHSINSGDITVSADNTAPTVTAANTVDSDGDGYIDQILVTLSENIDDDNSTLTNGTLHSC